MKLTRHQLSSLILEYFNISFPKEKTSEQKSQLINNLFDLLTIQKDRSPKRCLDHEKSLSAARSTAPSPEMVTTIESLYQNIGMVLPYIEDLKARHLRMTNKHRRHNNIDTPHVQKALDTLRALIVVLEDYVKDMRDQISDISA